MFYHKLTDRFERGLNDASPYPRGAVGANLSSRAGPKLGIAMALGAAVFGGLLVTANVNMRQQAPADVAAAEPAAPSPPPSVAEVPAQPAPVAPVAASAPAAPATPVAAAAKPATSLDMAATGAIGGEEPAKKIHPTATHPKAKKKPVAKAQ